MFADPATQAAFHRQHITDFAAQPALEHPGQAGAQFRVIQLGIARIDIVGELAFRRQVMPEILESGNDIGSIQTQFLGNGAGKRFGIGQDRLVILVLGGDALAVFPQRHAVGAPEQRESPARQGFAGIPFALAIMQQAARGKTFAQAPDQGIGQRPLGRAHRSGMPFRARAVVDGDKGRLSAHGEAHVLPFERPIDFVSQVHDLLPLLVGVRFRDAGRLLDAA